MGGKGQPRSKTCLQQPWLDVSHEHRDKTPLTYQIDIFSGCVDESDVDAAREEG